MKPPKPTPPAPEGTPDRPPCPGPGAGLGPGEELPPGTVLPADAGAEGAAAAAPADRAKLPAPCSRPAATEDAARISPAAVAGSAWRAVDPVVPSTVVGDRPVVAAR